MQPVCHMIVNGRAFSVTICHMWSVLPHNVISPSLPVWLKMSLFRQSLPVVDWLVHDTVVHPVFFTARHCASVTQICRDVNKTLTYETKTRPRHSVFGARRDWDQDLPAVPRDRDVWFLPRDETKTKTLQGWDRDVFPHLQPWKCFGRVDTAKLMNMTIDNSRITERWNSVRKGEVFIKDEAIGIFVRQITASVMLGRFW